MMDEATKVLAAQMATEVVGMFYAKFQRRPNAGEQKVIADFIMTNLLPSMTPAKRNIATKDQARERIADLMASNDKVIRKAVADNARGNGHSEEQVDQIVAAKMQELNEWRKRTLDEAWNWSIEPNAPSLKVH